MTRKLAVAISVTLLFGFGLAIPANAPLHSPSQAIASALPADTIAQAVVQTVCMRCHNDERLRGGLSLERFETEHADEDPEVAEKMIRKLRAGMMPPPGTRRPDEADLVALVEALETTVDAAVGSDPNPGARPFQRLNRAEYARSIRDLLGLEIDPSAYLPNETISAGFDNIADVQNLSATLLEGYLSAASEISRLALGDADATASETEYEVSRYAEQRQHVDGAPIGT